MSEAFFRTLARRAAARYPRRDRYARHFAYGKLTRDPVFRHVVEHGLIAPGSRVLDLGCGQGLLAALLAEAAAAKSSGEWPAGWPAPPEGCVVRGVDLAPRDIERARASSPQARFEEGDIRRIPFESADAVTLLDVLHYIGPDEQREVLGRVKGCLQRGGVLLVRVADARRSPRFAFTIAMDRAAMWLRGRRTGPLHCRPLDAWRAELAALGFRSEARPMSRGTGFSNVLLVARA